MRAEASETSGRRALADLRDAPNALWVWAALQAASFVVAPLLDPGAPTPRKVWLGFAVFWALMGVAIFRRSKLAWAVALFAAGWGLLGGLMFFVTLVTGEGDQLWFLWGLVLSVGSLWALLSQPMKEWVEEPPTSAGA